jgi:hypothetical protein
VLGGLIHAYERGPRRETPAARECIETQRARLHRRAHWAFGPSQASREQAIETETHRAPPGNGSGLQPPLSWLARLGFCRPTTRPTSLKLSFAHAAFGRSRCTASKDQRGRHSTRSVRANSRHGETRPFVVPSPSRKIHR